MKTLFHSIVLILICAGCASQAQIDALVGGGSTSIVNNTPVEASRPLIIASVAAVDFSDRPIGTSKTISISLLNAGTAKAKILTPVAPAGSVTLNTADCLNRTLEVGESCSLGTIFTPVALGAVNGYVTVPYQDLSAKPYSYVVSYSGNGIASQPSIASAPASSDFGSIATSSSLVRVFTISNSGAGTATFQAATITGTGYTITTDTCNTLAMTSASASCTISVTFAPLVPGSSLGVLTLNYQNSGGTPLTTTVALSGYGNVPQPVLTISPSPFNFGNVSTNGSLQQIFTVSNNTTVSAVLGTSSVSGSGYTITSSTCNSIVLGSAANCTVSVKFAPSSLGAVTGTLTVPFTSVQNIAYNSTVTLGGTGITPSVAFTFNGFTGVAGTDTSGLTATGVTLQWTAQTAASYYQVTQTGGSSGTVRSAHLTPTTISTYNVSGLTPNTTYQFKVNAFDATDTSDGNSNTVSITTPNVTGATFNGWSDLVATGEVFTDIGTVDNTMGNTGSNRMERNLAAVYGFGTADVNTGTSVITVSYAPTTGMPLKMGGDGTAPGGLTNGTIYYAINVSATQFKLASSVANANAGTAITLTTSGSGNMTLMPAGIAKLGWELFTFSPSGTATSYNIYRSTSSAGPFTLVGTSTSRSFNDNQVSSATKYYYKVYPVISGVEVVASTVADSVAEVYVPGTNMSLVHRWITNREACTNLLGFTWPAGVNRNDNYSCAYTWGTGYAPNAVNSKSKWDIGYSYAVDRWQNACKMKSYGQSAPTGGAVGDVYLYATNSISAGGIATCYIKDATSGWILETASLSNAQRALTRTNYPGYQTTGINQIQAMNSCAQRTVSGLENGNGGTSLRMMRVHEAILARALQGMNVNNRSSSLLSNVMNGLDHPANGSCSNNALNGVSFPNPGAYGNSFYSVMSGSNLTRNCYTRYEISNLWEWSSFEWTSTQLYIPSTSGGYFIQSALDPGDNLLENYLLNGSMGPTTTYSGVADSTPFASTSVSTPILPLFGVQATAASVSLGSRVMDFSLFDYAPHATTNSIYSGTTNNNGVVLGSSWYWSASNRNRHSLGAGEPTSNRGSSGSLFYTNRCAAQVVPSP